MPFLSFLLGYMVMQQLFRTPTTITPHLVGKQVHEILPITTQQNLNIRLINQKEEADLPEGMILNQTPHAGTSIKPHQQIFIVTSKKPSVIRTPNCVGFSLDDIATNLQTQSIRPRIYYLPHVYPEQICFAQSPISQEPLEKNKLILYISSGNSKPVIWPDFTNLALQEVTDFLNIYGIQPYIINDASHKGYTNDDYIVVDQRPFAGTLLTIDEKQPLSVQLRIR